MDLIGRFEGWRGKALLVSLSTLIGFLMVFIIGEIYIRLAKPYVTVEKLRASSLQYEKGYFAHHVFPQREQRIQTSSQNFYINQDFYINSLGYRGKPFNPEKPPGCTRIVVMGGSSAFNGYAPEGRDWPHLVQQKLHILGISNVEVINAGTPGHTMVDCLGRLFTEIWMFQPDYIILYCTWNDIKYFHYLKPEVNLMRTSYHDWDNMALKNKTKHFRLPKANPFTQYTGPIDRFFGKNSQLYVRLRWRYWSWRLGKLGLEGPLASDELFDDYGKWGLKQYELTLRLIASVAREIGAIPVFLTEGRLISSANTKEERDKIYYSYVHLTHDAVLRAYSEADDALFRVAKEVKAPFLDVSQIISGHNEFFADHVHFLPAGSEKIAEIVSQFLFDTIQAVNTKNVEN